MNKHQFMSSLKIALAPLDPAAVTDILADFEEHFAAGHGRGKSEEAISAELGDPAEIGRQYAEAAADGKVPGQTGPLYQSSSAGPGHQTAQPNPWQAASANQSGSPGASGQSNPGQPGPSVMPPASAHQKKIDESALVGVILLNIFLGIPLWVALFSALTGFWLGAGSIGAAAVVLFVVAVFQAGFVSLILVLFGVALTALTILAVILMVYLTKWLVLGLSAWIRWNRRLVYGGVPA